MLVTDYFEMDIIVGKSLFEMDIIVGNILTHACVHPAFSHLYTKTTPFGKWRLKIIESETEKINLDGLNEVNPVC